MWSFGTVARRFIDFLLQAELTVYSCQTRLTTSAMVKMFSFSYLWCDFALLVNRDIKSAAIAGIITLPAYFGRDICW